MIKLLIPLPDQQAVRYIANKQNGMEKGLCEKNFFFIITSSSPYKRAINIAHMMQHIALRCKEKGKGESKAER